MSSQRQWLAGIVGCCALLSSGATLRTQARFEAVTLDTVSAMPGLQIVTLRDNLLNVCFTLFVIQAASAAQNVAPAEATSIQDAAGERDRRLSELSRQFETAQSSAVPGTLGANVLKYEWEGQKAQSEFEQVLRENQISRLEARLKQIADAPKLAVSGPGACTARAPASQDRQKK